MGSEPLYSELERSNQTGDRKEGHTGLARASAAVGLSEEFGFKSERMKFFAVKKRGVRQSDAINQYWKAEPSIDTFFQYRSWNSI